MCVATGEVEYEWKIRDIYFKVHKSSRIFYVTHVKLGLTIKILSLLPIPCPLHTIDGPNSVKISVIIFKTQYSYLCPLSKQIKV